MTINRFAILPKYCDCCKRTFIFEKYHRRYVEVGIEHYSLKVYVCDKCFKEKFNKELKKKYKELWKELVK